jgi:transposase-like protein
MVVDVSSKITCPKCGREEDFVTVKRREDVVELSWYCPNCRYDWGIELPTRAKVDVTAQIEKYAEKWMKVQDVIAQAQKQIEKIVEEVCKMVEEDLSPTLEALRQHLKFTYVIQPKLGNGDILSCTPTLIIDAPYETYQIVQKILISLYPDICSEARLTVERKPPTLLP